MSVGAIASRVLNIGKRAVNMAPNYIMGNGHEVFGKTFETSMKNLKGQPNVDWFGRFGKSFKAAGKAAETASKGKGWGAIWKDFSSIPKSLKFSTLKGYASGTGRWSKLWGGIKGLGKGIGRKLPAIGTALMLAFELPNIFKATVNDGIVAGAAETVKAGAKLAGGLTGAAIGQVLIPIPVVGGLIGWIGGECLTSKLVGKSYSEKKAEQEEKITQAMNAYGQSTQAATQAQMASNPYLQQMMMYQMMNGGGAMNDDIMYNAYKATTPQLDVKA